MNNYNLQWIGYVEYILYYKFCAQQQSCIYSPLGGCVSLLLLMLGQCCSFFFFFFSSLAKHQNQSSWWIVATAHRKTKHCVAACLGCENLQMSITMRRETTSCTAACLGCENLAATWAARTWTWVMLDGCGVICLLMFWCPPDVLSNACQRSFKRVLRYNRFGPCWNLYSWVCLRRSAVIVVVVVVVRSFC